MSNYDMISASLSDCGICIACVGGKSCSYKNPESFKDSPVRFVHPPRARHHRREGYGDVEEAREWLDARRKKSSLSTTLH